MLQATKMTESAIVPVSGTMWASDSEDSCDWKPLEVVQAYPVSNCDGSDGDFDLEVEEDESTPAERKRWRGWLKCPHCPYYRTRLPAELKDHERLCFRLRWYRCSMCLFKTISANVRRRHFILKHTYNNKPLVKCKHCKFATFSLNKLELHQRAYHRCTFCVCTDVTYAPATETEEIHDPYFHCDECSYRAIKVSHLRMHKKVAHGKTFRNPWNVQDREGDPEDYLTFNSYEGEKRDQYSCTLCSYKFPNVAGYNRHIKCHPVHTKNKSKKETHCYNKAGRKKKEKDVSEKEKVPVIEHKCTNCSFKSTDATQLFIHQFSKVCFRLNRSNGRDKPQC